MMSSQESIPQDQCADQVIHRPLASLMSCTKGILGPVGELDASIGIKIHRRGWTLSPAVFRY